MNQSFFKPCILQESELSTNPSNRVLNFEEIESMLFLPCSARESNPTTSNKKI